jgi:hypothetical protein
MSPFCLIDVAGIRNHTNVASDALKTTWQARLVGWLSRALRRFRR